MKTTKKFFALLLSFALVITTFAANSEVNAAASADTTTQTDTITVTLRVEDANQTLIPSTRISLTQQDADAINETFNSPTETPVLETGDITAAHALAKYVCEISDTPTEDLTFAYQNPSYIKGQSDLAKSYWSYRVNHTSPTASDGYTQYNFTQCPIKDGDNIVLFRQANSAEGYTCYSYFDKEQYETVVNEKISITYQKEDFDESWNTVTSPAKAETISVENGTEIIKNEVTNDKGIVELSFDKPGTYTISSGRLDEQGIPVNSRAFATITVKDNVDETPVPASPAPSSTPVPAIAPQVTVTPSVTPAVKKPAAPKNVKAKVKGKKVTLSWKKVKSAKGYVVSVSKNNKKNFKKLATTSKTKLSKKFKKGNYYVKIRSYIKANGKKVYSKYSKTISVKVK